MPWSKLSEVPSNFKSVAPTNGGKQVTLTLAQANKLAEIYDALKAKGDVDSPMAVAITQFRKMYVVKDDKWVKAKNEGFEGVEDMHDSNESIWISVPGSYEEDIRLIEEAVQGSTAFGMKDYEYDVRLEATFPDYVIVRNECSNKYFKADWKKNQEGGVEISRVKEITFESATKEVNESKKLVETVRKETKTKNFNETIITNISLNEADGGKKKGKVEIAQKGDVRNANGRIYKSKALQEAVNNAKERIGKYGPLLMDYEHRTKDGKNHRNLRETVALIHDVNFHPDTNIVSLDEITFVDTQAGQDLIALMEGGAKLQVSQRGVGSSEIVRDDDGTVSEIVDEVYFDGWDFVPPGEASVSDADFEVLTEGRKLPDNVLSADETRETIVATIAESEQRITNAVLAALGKAGVTPATEDEETEQVPAESEEEPLEEIQEDPTGETNESVKNPLFSEFKMLKKDLDATRVVLSEIQKEKTLGKLNEVGGKILTEMLTDEAYARFNEKQKQEILSNISPIALYGKVDVSNARALRESLTELLISEVDRLDRYIAAAKLNAMGYKAGEGNGTGIVRVNDAEDSFLGLPAMQTVTQLGQMIERQLTSGGTPPVEMPEGFDKFEKLALKNFYEQNQRLLNEAGEELTQSDIGIHVLATGAMIPAALRRITALQFCDVGTMTERSIQIPIQSLLPAETADIGTDLATYIVGEGGTIPMVGTTYAKYMLYATDLKFGTSLTPEVLATAKGSGLNPLADALAGLALFAAQLEDRAIWTIMISRAQAQSSTNVTIAETLTQVGLTNEWQAVNQGWIQYEWLKSVDANGNPTSTVLNKLYGTGASSSVFQVLVVDDNLATGYTYATDYTVNWPDGSITLTSTGAAKFSGAGATSMNAKYSYTSNAVFWSIVPPTNITLYDHLINFKQKMGDGMLLVENRLYEVNFIGMNNTIERLVASGPFFTNAGNSPAETLNAMNSVTRFSGINKVERTSALPQGWTIVGRQGACQYRTQTPWHLKGPITDATTSKDTYHALKFVGIDVAVPEMLGLLGITDINT